MKPTTEELLLQILSTCLLISSQGTWRANFYLHGHTGSANITLYPFNHWDLPEDQRKAVDHGSFPDQYAHYASPYRDWPTEEDGQERLQQLLEWAQGYLDLGQDQEVPPCAA